MNRKEKLLDIFSMKSSHEEPKENMNATSLILFFKRYPCQKLPINWRR